MTRQVPPNKHGKRDWLSAYLDYTKISEAPNKFHFWTGVSTIGSALERKCYMDMEIFQWTPNFYIFFVSPPGIIKKSSTINIGMRLLRQIDGVKFGPNALTYAYLTQEMAEAKKADSLPDNRMFPHCSMTISAGEMGTLIDPHDRQLIDTLCEMWDGRIMTFKKGTKTSGVDEVVNPWLNMISCTTPGWMSEHFPDYLVSGGFTSRSIFLYGDKTRYNVAYPKYVKNKESRELREQLIKDLEEISEIAGEFELDNSAIIWGQKWYEEFKENIPPHLRDGRLSGYVARKQTHVHKLAMVLSASERSDRVITKEHLQMADLFCQVVEGDMPQVFQHIGVTGDSYAAMQVVAIVKSQRGIPAEDLLRQIFRFAPGKKAEEAIRGAQAAGYIYAMRTGDGVLRFYPKD